MNFFKKAKLKLLISLGLFMYGLLNGFTAKSEDNENPNIVIILADDLGWGPIQAYNPSSVIPTPNINELAEEGMLFTNAHSASAVCTPTRYGLLTGRYPWRTRLKDGVVFPPGKPLINEEQETIGSLLQDQGYYTSVIGKWHLGLDWTMKGKKKIDFEAPVKGGPNTLGFDESFIIAGSLDMPPYCYIRNARVEEKPTLNVPKEKFGRAGLAVKGLEPENVMPRFTDEAVKIIENHAQQRSNQPLFLYYPLTAPHTPVAPSKPFQGKTTMGEFGDFVYEVDWTIGRVIEALKENNMYENTLLIFTSDNGTSPNGARQAMLNGQDVSGPWRGMKTDIWEGGTRVPFIASWPGHIPEGTTQDAMISLNDMLATFASLTDADLCENAGVDSYNMLPAFLNQNPKQQMRETTVVQSHQGYFGVLQGSWKAAFCAGSGGWGSSPGNQQALEKGMPKVQLYNLETDRGEVNNLEAEYPDMVYMLERLLLYYIDQGRSTPGKKQENWKGKRRWEQINYFLDKK